MYPNLQLLAAVVSRRKRQLGPRQRRRLQLCRYGCVNVAFQHSTQVFHGSSAIGIWVDACVDHPTDHLKVFISEMLQLRIHQVRHCLRNLERPSSEFGRMQIAPSLLIAPEFFSDLERIVFQLSKSTSCTESGRWCLLLSSGWILGVDARPGVKKLSTIYDIYNQFYSIECFQKLGRGSVHTALGSRALANFLDLKAVPLEA
nr:hypothetical protein Iba_chr13dCG9880 [Ipomoea batatas]